jgi:hypothetical protein
MAFIESLRAALERADDRVYPLYLSTALLLLCLWGIAYVPALRERILVDCLLLFTSLLILWGMGEALLLVMRSYRM